MLVIAGFDPQSLERQRVWRLRIKSAMTSIRLYRVLQQIGDERSNTRADRPYIDPINNKKGVDAKS